MKKAILSIVSILAGVLGVMSQNYVTPVRSDITPPSPQSASIVAVQNPAPDLLTGAVNLAVPIYTISENGVELPISLQYHTNGIKVFDDPATVGYGWSLMPALRATRTVMGRPDELYKFSGDPYSYPEFHGAAFMCVVQAHGESYQYNERLDPEHDIFTFALPNKTITRVLDNQDGKMDFVGAGDTEYKVSSDDNLKTITVTDPYANKYIFGGWYETYNEECGALVMTAWALEQIVLDNGETINLTWTTDNHPYSRRRWLGGHSFMDNWDQFQWGNSGLSQDTFESDNADEAIFSHIHETNAFLSLQKISFKGGCVDFTYKWTFYGPMLTRISVSNKLETVRDFTLSYCNSNYTLLSSLDGGEGNKYSFIYNTDYSSSHFYNIHDQDWWGYYNAKGNESLTPDIHVKTYYCIQNEKGGHKYNLGRADRSVDGEAMQAFMLKQVTWPTGGTSSFVYEPHRFAPTRMESNGEIDSNTDPLLSFGGGLRVKEITTTTGTDDLNPLTVRYEYPLARVRAVPSAATFVEVYDVAFPMPDVPSYTSDLISRMRKVNIMPVSDYMKYDIGTLPIWYDKVTEIWPEGKNEIYFSDIFEDYNIEFGKPLLTYGRRRPSNHQIRIFNGTPVQTKQVNYRTVNDVYIPVEKTESQYKWKYGTKVPSSYHIAREILCQSNSTSSPDFIDGYKISELAYGQSESVYNAYSCYSYAVCPYYWNLTGKIHTVYTDTGDSIVTTENYDYYRYTELLKSVSTTTSEGKTRSVTVDYPSSAKGGWQSQMVSANVVGVPVHEKITNGNATTDIYAEYTRTASGAFRQSRTASVYGGSADTLYSPTCKYDRLGNLV